MSRETHRRPNQTRRAMSIVLPLATVALTLLSHPQVVRAQDRADDSAPGGVVGFVWDDTDDNGRYDLGESSLSGVTLHLHAEADASATIEAAVSDDDGFYEFELEPQSTGNYLVSVPANLWMDEGELVGFRSSTDSFAASRVDNGIDPTGSDRAVVSAVVVVSGAGPDRSVDFGFHAPVHSIDGTVFEDLDENGRFDAGEPPLSGVWIEVHADVDRNGVPDDLDGDGELTSGDLIGTDTTDAGGRYVVDELNSGSYVASVPPAAWDSTMLPAGSPTLVGYGSSSEGSPTGADGRVSAPTVTLDEGGSSVDDSSDNATIDFGFTMSATRSSSTNDPEPTCRFGVRPQNCKLATSIQPDQASANGIDSTPQAATTQPVAEIAASSTPAGRSGAAYSPVTLAAAADDPPAFLPRVSDPAPSAHTFALAEGATPFLVLIAIGLMGLAATYVAARRQNAPVPVEQEPPPDGPNR